MKLNPWKIKTIYCDYSPTPIFDFPFNSFVSASLTLHLLFTPFSTLHPYVFIVITPLSLSHCFCWALRDINIPTCDFAKCLPRSKCIQLQI